MTKIDIISGFLGAGKTTLIKKLLQEAFKQEQVVLIENEFGEIGIDGGFLKDAGVEITEMNSGCICCSLVGDFASSIKEIIEKYDVLIDNITNLNIILNAIGVKNIGTINKNRICYIYKNKYEFSFDTVKDIGMFIEIELINKSENFEKDFCELLNVLEELKIDLNMVERRKYIDYI